MTGLVIVAPIPITDTMLVTDVPETDYPAWNAVTAYAVGDRAIRTGSTQHKIYQRVVAGTTATAPESDAVNWIQVSPTNRWKAFDASNSTQTAQTTSMFFRMTPGVAVNALYAGNITGGTAIRLRSIDPVYGTVYDKTTSLTGSPRLPDYWEWFFGPWTAGTGQLVAIDLPTMPNAEIRVDLTGGPTLAIGVLLLGQPVEFGFGVKYGARTGINDFTVKTTNTFGDIVVTPRAFAKRVQFSVLLDNVDIDGMQEFLASVRGIPCLYIISALYGVTVVFGYYKNFEITIPYPTESQCDAEIEGLT
jgi:hypothetical protein